METQSSFVAYFFKGAGAMRVLENEFERECDITRTQSFWQMVMIFKF